MCVDELKDLLNQYPADATVKIAPMCSGAVSGVEYDEETNTVTIW